MDKAKPAEESTKSAAATATETAVAMAANAGSSVPQEQSAAAKPEGKPEAKGPGKPGGGPGGPGGRPKKKPLSTPLEIFGIVVFAAVWFAPPVLGLEPKGMHMLAVFALCLVFWIFNPIPAELTGMIMMFLPPILGIVKLQVGVSGFQSSTTWFLVGGLIIGRMIAVSGLDKRITLTIVKLFGGKSLSLWKVVISIVILCFLLTLVVPSGTVLSLLLGAQVYPLVKLYGVDEKSNVAKMLMLSVPIFVLLCGNESLSGSSHNLVLLGCLEDAGINISWIGWFLAILPDTIIVTVILLFTYKLFLKPEKTQIEGGREEIIRQLKDMGKFSMDEKKACILFLVALVLWVTNALTNIPVAITAIGVAIVAMLPRIGCLDFRDAIKKINWPIILFVGAVLGIPSMMEAVGMNEAFTTMFNAMMPFFNGPVGFVIFLWLLAQITAWLGLSIGSPLLFVPFMFPIAQGMGMPPVYAALMQGYMQPTVMYYHAPAPLVCADYGCYQQSDYIKFQLIVVLGKIIATPILVGLWWPFLVSVGIL